MKPRIIQNWDRTQSWEPETIYVPKDEDGIVAVIQRAIEAKKRVKVIGSALSWSDVIDQPAISVLCDNMTKVLHVDRDNRQIRLQAGARLNQINDVLAENGLAFDNFGSIVTQTAAGYIATGSHGTGAKTQMLSAHVDSIRMIDGLGEAHDLDAAHEPELFSAACVNLGCLGIITEIAFRCVEAFDIEERLELVDFDTVLADLGDYVKDNDYCKLWWLPYTEKVQVYLFNRTTKRYSGLDLPRFMDHTGLSGMLFNILIGLGKVYPKAIPLIHETVQRIHFHPHSRVDRSDKIIRVSSSIPIHQETEYAIPIELAPQAINEARRLILRSRHKANFPMEVRFVAADNIQLSPANGRDSCFIGPYVSSRKWAPPLFTEFEELICDYAGRPHWGKSFSLTPEKLQGLYPAYESFNQLRKRCDPHGLFRNSFVDRVFPS